MIIRRVDNNLSYDDKSKLAEYESDFLDPDYYESEEEDEPEIVYIDAVIDQRINVYDDGGFDIEGFEDDLVELVDEDDARYVDPIKLSEDSEDILELAPIQSRIPAKSGVYRVVADVTFAYDRVGDNRYRLDTRSCIIQTCKVTPV